MLGPYTLASIHTFMASTPGVFTLGYCVSHRTEMVRWIDALNPPDTDQSGNTTYELWGKRTLVHAHAHTHTHTHNACYSH